MGRSVSPLFPDVLLQSGQGLNVAFSVGNRHFTQEFYSQRSLEVEKEREHHLSIVLIAFFLQRGIRAKE